MTITYLEKAPAEIDHQKLLSAAHPSWPPDHQKQVFTAFANSDYAISAYDANLLVGTVRVFTDQVGFAMIADLLVLPSHRHQGIGSQLIAMCKKSFNDVYIYADPQSKSLDNFYRANGFTKQAVFRLTPKD